MRLFIRQFQSELAKLFARGSQLTTQLIQARFARRSLLLQDLVVARQSLHFGAQRRELECLIGEVLDRGIAIARGPLRMLVGRDVVREGLEVELDGNRAVGFGNRGILRYCCTLLHRDKRLPNADAPTTFQYRPPLVTLERQ